MDIQSALKTLTDAVEPVLAEAKERADYQHYTWNPDAHVEMTLTIQEIRNLALANAKAKALLGESPVSTHG
jgi:hypothetical protein